MTFNSGATLPKVAQGGRVATQRLRRARFISTTGPVTSHGSLATVVGRSGTWSRSPLGGSRLPRISCRAFLPDLSRRVRSVSLSGAFFDSRKLPQIPNQLVTYRANESDPPVTFVSIVAVPHDTNHEVQPCEQIRGYSHKSFAENGA